MSAEARIMSGLMLLSIITIEFGGTFMLSILRGQQAGFTELQKNFFRAGHAHAGVLVSLGLILQFLVDQTGMASGLQWFVRIGAVAAPILISAGFFLAVIGSGQKPNRLVALIYTGAGLLALSLLVLGVGLLTTPVA